MTTEHFDFRGAARLIPSSFQTDAEQAIAVAPTKASEATAAKVRTSLLHEFVLRGWPDRVPINNTDSKLSISSLKERTGLCVQFGNFARTYADLLKLEVLRSNGHIDAAIFIVPCDKLARRLGSNLARFDRLSRELEVFRPVLACPILVYGVS